MSRLQRRPQVPALSAELRGFAKPETMKLETVF